MPDSTSFTLLGSDVADIYLTKEKYSALTGTPTADAQMTELWAFGLNNGGQLGNNSTADSTSPVRVYEGGNNWLSVSMSRYNAAGIKNDGTLWIWGVNDTSAAPVGFTEPGGLLGINTTTGNNRSSPITTFAGGTTWKQIALGPYTHAGVKSDGTLWTWGINRSTTLGVSGIAGQNAAAVDQYDDPALIAGTNNNYRQVSLGSNFGVALKTDGVAWSWGSAAFGKLANGSTTINRSSPQTLTSAGTTWKLVSAGDNHTVGIQLETGRLLAFGDNQFGQLGLNHAFNRSSPVFNNTYGGSGWKKAAAGGDNSAAIKTDGTLWTWGVEAVLSVNRSSPQTTFAGGTNWSSVSVGGNRYYAAIKTDGTLWTWGTNGVGELGSGDLTARSSPQTTAIGGNNWKSVTAGFQSTLALKDKVL